MIIPFDGHLISPLAFAVAVPYFLAMAVDLRYCGYKALDAARIYGFNLLLLPVNLAGSLSSVVQALTGAKGKFIRTPKVRDRTVPAFFYVVLPYAAGRLVGLHLQGRLGDTSSGRNAVFAAINGVLAAYAIVAFIGVRNSLVDIWANVVSWLYKPQGPKKMAARAPLAASRRERRRRRLGAGPLHGLRRPPPPSPPEADRRPAADDRIELRLPVTAPAFADSGAGGQAGVAQDR